MKVTVSRILFFALALSSLFFSPAVALCAGIVLALLFCSPYAKQSKKTAKYLLQIAVVGLGFGINLHQSLQAGREGVLFTVASITCVMLLGYIIGSRLRIAPKLTHLISSGTAICGGSAIAAIAPIVNADENETSVSLAIIFALNAIALFLFPPIGHLLHLSQSQFGMWAAIAIHDTSSVVGAGSIYGPEALTVAVTVKLMRALWIIPLSFISIFLYKRGVGQKIHIPWFILCFVLAMAISTYAPIPEALLSGIGTVSHRLLSLTLFLIGSTLSVNALKQVGVKPVLLGISLWVAVSLLSLTVIYLL